MRHGQLAKDNKTIEFKSLCGLIIKQNLLEENGGVDPNKKMAKKPVKKSGAKVQLKKEDCIKHPFPEVFDYIECEVYQGTFKSSSRTNDVIPTKDFQYSDALSGSSITDMELL